MSKYFDLVLSVLIGIIGVLALFGLAELNHVSIGVFLLSLSLQHYINYLEKIAWQVFHTMVIYNYNN